MFNLTESQKLKELKIREAVKLLFGEEGDFEYRFKPNTIGITIKIYSYNMDKEYDITDLESW